MRKDIWRSDPEAYERQKEQEKRLDREADAFLAMHAARQERKARLKRQKKKARTA